MAFKYKGATIDAREMTIGDEEQIGTIARKLAATGANIQARYGFGEFMVGATVSLTQVDGSFVPAPLLMVDEYATVEATEAAYAEWRKLPRAFLAKWRETLDAANSENGTSFT